MTQTPIPPITVALAEGDPAAERWSAAAALLEPDKSLDRLVNNAKFVVSTTSTVGVLLTAFGAFAASTIAEEKTTKLLALITLTVAAFSVVCAVSPLITRVTKINPDNLDEVRAWYLKQFSSSKLITTAGISLLISLLLAAATGIGVGITTTSREPSISLGIVQLASGRTASISIRTPATTSDVKLTATVAVLDSGKSTPVYEAYQIVPRGSEALLNQKIQIGPSHGCVTLRVSYWKVTREQQAGCRD